LPKTRPVGSDCSTQRPTLRETNSRSRVFSTSRSSVAAVNTFPLSSRSICRISSRRCRKPLPSIQATTSYGRIPSATCLSRCVASTLILATLSRAVPSSLVIFASMTTDGVLSSGIQKSGAWPKPGMRSARFVFRNVILCAQSYCSTAFSITSPINSDTASR